MSKLPQSPELIKSRVNKIKEINQQSSTIIESLFLGNQTTINQITTDNDNKTIINKEELKQSFKQALTNPNKDTKFGFFIQQANEMFQNYEKEIAELKHKLCFFESSKLIYTPSISVISLSLTKQEAFFHKMKQFTQEETTTINDICTEYNKKIADLFQENADLTKIIDKISNTVITKLQDKIKELSQLYDDEKIERTKAQNQLDSLDSIFQQNSDIKASNIEKDKYIVTLNGKVNECERDIRQRNSQINYMTDMIETFRETLEKKEKKIAEDNKTELDHKSTIDKLKEEVELKQKEIKEKEDEIKLLLEDNVQWEEKHTLQSKEIENYKKWSLWDDNLIDLFKRIDILQSEITFKNSDIDRLQNDNEKLIDLNTKLTQELNESNQKNEVLRRENDSLVITKLLYEKEKDKIDKYDCLLLDNLKMKKEINTRIDKYENQIKTERNNYETNLNAIQNNYENKIRVIQIEHENKLKGKQSEYDIENNNKISTIEALENKVNEDQIDNKELRSQLEQKNQMTINLKEAYDNLIKKYKSQEEKLNLLESINSNSNSNNNNDNQISFTNKHCEITTSNNNNEDNNRNTHNHSNKNNNTKMHSKLDKYAFTTEILIDYIYCLYLYESSVNIQNIIDILLSNMNIYMNTLFQNNTQSGPIISEFLEDIFFLSYNKYYEKKAKTNPNDLNYKVNFEQFDRDTIDTICNVLYSTNPLSLLKQRKTIDQLVALFISKYESVFDFDMNMQSYINKEIFPSVQKKIQKHQMIIMDDLHTLIEMALHNIQEGRIILNDTEIYSYEQYHNQFKKMKLDDNQKTLIVKDGLTDKASIDNVAFILKQTNLGSVCFIKMFDWNTEMNMNKIISTMMLYANNLHSLSVKGNNCTGPIFKTQINKLIKSLKRLKSLDLSNNGLNDDDIKLLCDTIKSNSFIEEVNIDCNRITSKGGYYLADALSKNISIASLSANNNQLNEGGLISLFGVLTNNNSTLTKMFLGGNSLAKDDYTVLSEYLSTNPVLSLLDISGNSIDVKSANNLGIAFTKAKHLKIIYANMMNLDEESCSLLLNYLNETSISELSLDKNVFSDTGAIVLVNKIKICHQLERVSLKMCGLPSMFFTLFAQIFKNKSNMKEANFESNPIEDDILLLLGKGLVSNLSLIVKISKGDYIDKTIEALAEYKNIVFV